MELTEREQARLAEAPDDLPEEVKAFWVVSWDHHHGDLDRFRGFLAKLILHILEARPEAARPFEDLPHALDVLRVLAGEDVPQSGGSAEPS